LRWPNQAFVATWFHTDLDDVWENGLKPALQETGYEPLRIDRIEHNEKIDDRIIAEIRNSGLLVADFTGHRGGVYFEAGFAMGLGMPIIRTCRDTDIKELHFDTRQYGHVVWTDVSDLKEKLINRINATLPNKTEPSL
jgi:nucleoside 2-deoxyribosyltransferase